MQIPLTSNSRSLNHQPQNSNALVDLVLGSAVAFSEGLRYSDLDATFQRYMLLPSITCPELKHSALSTFIQQHAVLSGAAATSDFLSPNSYKLNANAWQHAHSLLSHTGLHHGSSLLSLARAQFDACMIRNSPSFEELLRGHSTQSLPSPSSLETLFSHEVLLLLRGSLLDLWMLVQVKRAP
jgi:hypothetical protein